MKEKKNEYIVAEHLIPFGPYFTWARVSNLPNIQSGLAPLVIIHGGPGIPHDYCVPMIALCEGGRTVIHYDQIGCGRSSHFHEADPDFWSVDLFVEELRNLVAFFKIESGFHLLGQSWGGMLGPEYVLRYPEGVLSLTISNSPASMQLWTEGTSRLLALLPLEVQDTILEHEAAGTTEAQAYKDAVSLFYKRHFCTIQPYPEALSDSFRRMEENPIVYQIMVGPSEFSIKGSLKDWSVVDRLSQITTPCLVLAGEFDEAVPTAWEPFVKNIPYVESHVFPGASHTPHLESPAEYFSVVGKFLKKHDREALKKVGRHERDNLPPGSCIPSESNALESLGYRQVLKRTMSLVDVVVYGLIYMVPMAPIAVFGFIYNFSHGMTALVYIVAAIAMAFSALSYKEMARRYPVAGSVYSYVRFGINNYFGYLAGWAILLDYILLPALLSAFAASAMVGLYPAVPIWIWVIAFVIAAAFVNLGGIGLTSSINKIFLAAQLVVICWFTLGVGNDLLRDKISLSVAPLYNNATFSWAIVFGSIPIAALSFVGFDAISTLNEEAKGGGETVSKATMIVLVVVAVLFVVQVYLASLYVHPGALFTDGLQTSNAFYSISGRIGGDLMKIVVTLTSALIAIFANSIASMATSSRLVFSMARDRQLPEFLATVSKRNGVPLRATILITGLSLAVGIFGSEHLDLLTTLVTFGALTAYVLLNIAVVVRFGLIERSPKVFLHWISPIIGTAILGYALWHANQNAQILGVAWMGLGLVGAVFLHFSGRLTGK